MTGQSDKSSIYSAHELIDSRTLRAIADQLRFIILQMTQLAEIHEISSSSDLTLLKDNGKLGLKLIDNYLLGIDIIEGQQEIVFEPVSLSSLVTQIAHDLTPLAEVYNTSLKVDIRGITPPVVADRAVLRAAITSLGQSVIMGREIDFNNVNHLTLAVHRSPSGYITGFYGQGLPKSYEINRGLKLKGFASQPFRSLLPSVDAGLFVGGSLLTMMGSRLRGSHLSGQPGLASTFMRSRQLSLMGDC